MRLDRRDSVESVVRERQLRNAPFSDADPADVDPACISSMCRSYTFFRVIYAVNFSLAGHGGQFADRPTTAATDIENCVRFLNLYMAQAPVGQFRMMPIHVPQNKPTKKSRRLPALTDDFLRGAHYFFLRRARCLAETDRIISAPAPLVGSGVFDCATAAASNAFTSDRFSRLADSNWINRVWFPSPRRI